MSCTEKLKCERIRKSLLRAFCRGGDFFAVWVAGGAFCMLIY